MKTLATTLSFALVLTAGLLSLDGSRRASAHCQVPCGIYDDHARVHRLLEDVTTIDKAVTNIKALAGKSDAQSLNQATRWVVTKEAHASHIISVMTEFFLAQRVKPADPKDKKEYQDYLQRLVEHHRVILLAMKAKQTVDLPVVGKLRKAVQALEKYYPPAKH